MIPVLLAAAAVATASPCPADLLVAHPRLKLAPDTQRGFQHDIVTVDVTNRGTREQRPDTKQHLDLLRDGVVIGSQPIPALGPGVAYIAAFRLRLPAARRHVPLVVRFHYVLDAGQDASRENCTTANDVLDATL